MRFRVYLSISPSSYWPTSPRPLWQPFRFFPSSFLPWSVGLEALEAALLRSGIFGGGEAEGEPRRGDAAAVVVVEAGRRSSSQRYGETLQGKRSGKFSSMQAPPYFIRLRIFGDTMRGALEIILVIDHCICRVVQVLWYILSH